MAPERAQAEVHGAGPSRDPSWVARVLADGWWLARLAAFFLVLSPAWAIHDKLRLDLPVPPLLWTYAGAGTLLFLVVVTAKLFSKEVRRAARYNEAKRDTEHLLAEARGSLRDHAQALSPVQVEELGRATGELEAARSTADWERATTAVATLDERLDDYLADHRKSTVREYVESILIAVSIAFFLRAFVVEAFKIPSGSMIPTLQVGDHIFVNKFIYGIRIPWTDIKLGMGVRKPERGEVVVFKFPKDPDKDFIKRIVAVEGDTVEIRGNVPWVNGVPIAREHVQAGDGGPCEYEDFEEVTQRWEHRRCDAWQETANGHRYTTIFDRGSPPRSWPKVTVPPRSVFVMGDNRDNSHDSRYWGFVPFELLRGKAMVIWWSLGEPEGIRVNRIGQLIE